MSPQQHHHHLSPDSGAVTAPADDVLAVLAHGPLHHFRDWPNADVPTVAAGVYTVWRGSEFLYVGMAGRSLTADAVLEHRATGSRVTGLFSRLATHAAGRRSGDQFCVYVADRLVLPQLSAEQLRAIAAGGASFDALIRAFVRAHLAYRVVEISDGATARAVESRLKRGEWPAGKPLLNPSRDGAPARAGGPAEPSSLQVGHG